MTQVLLSVGIWGWSRGNITDEMIQMYLEHQRSKVADDDSDIILI